MDVPALDYAKPEKKAVHLTLVIGTVANVVAAADALRYLQAPHGSLFTQFLPLGAILAILMGLGVGLPAAIGALFRRRFKSAMLGIAMALSPALVFEAIFEPICWMKGFRFGDCLK